MRGVVAYIVAVEVVLLVEADGGEDAPRDEAAYDAEDQSYTVSVTHRAQVLGLQRVHNRDRP